LILWRSASSKAYRVQAGLATYVPGDWVAKRVEVLRELVPGASKIAILVNPGNPMHKLILADEVPSTARKLGVALPIVEATTAEEIDIAFAYAATQSRLQRSIICRRFISSDKSPMAD
jgi:hypothetical protein